RRNRQSRGQRSGSDPYFVMVTGPLSGGQEDSIAEQAEGGAAIRLAFDHLESVDVALDHSRAPGHGEAVQDGVLIALDSEGEGVQAGLVAGLDRGDPVAAAVPVQAGEDLGEHGHRVKVTAPLSVFAGAESKARDVRRLPPMAPPGLRGRRCMPQMRVT